MLIYILIVIFSIIMHEFGHLFACLLFKVKVNAFSIGFGKILFHKKWKGIDWRLSLIPLGGYCGIEERIDKKNSLAEISYWKQMIVILAGVSCNLIIAIICYLINYGSIKLGLIIDWKILTLLIKNEQELISFIIYYLKPNTYLLQMSLLNIGLAVTNLFPIPALDGGYIWLLPLQKKMSDKMYKTIIYIGFTAVMILQFVLIYYWWF